MKIVLWVGNEANQKALAHKIHALYPIAGIVTETRNNKLKPSALSIADKVIEKIFLSRIGKSWWNMISYYRKKYPTYPTVKLLNVENINSNEAYNFTDDIAPDLIVVSGTRLIKEKMLSITPSIGIINLHTGLSPYIKGGPNCTNWCISTGQFHLIGNTIMWIDKGIDSGNIITTEHTTFTGNESLSEVHLKVMDHAHQLYVDAIHFLAQGKINNIKQETIIKGTTYYSKQWNLKRKARLLINFKKFRKTITSKENEVLKRNVVTVSI